MENLQFLKQRSEVAYKYHEALQKFRMQRVNDWDLLVFHAGNFHCLFCWLWKGFYTERSCFHVYGRAPACARLASLFLHKPFAVLCPVLFSFQLSLSFHILESPEGPLLALLYN